MRYQQVFALLILGQGKGKHIKVKDYTWVKQRKDKQAQKGLTKDNML
jgi:hypothetical protein